MAILVMSIFGTAGLLLINLVPRVSSLLFLYSGMYKRPCGDLIGCNSVLRGNYVLHGVNGGGMSKFDGKPQSLAVSTITCSLSPKLEGAISSSKLR